LGRDFSEFPFLSLFVPPLRPLWTHRTCAVHNLSAALFSFHRPRREPLLFFVSLVASPGMKSFVLFPLSLPSQKLPSPRGCSREMRGRVRCSSWSPTDRSRSLLPESFYPFITSSSRWRRPFFLVLCLIPPRSWYLPITFEESISFKPPLV